MSSAISAVFCISARFGLSGIFSRCFSVLFLIIAKALITTGIVTVSICHSFSISISRPLCLDSFSNSATETFLSAGICASISLQVFSLLSWDVGIHNIYRFSSGGIELFYCVYSDIHLGLRLGLILDGQWFPHIECIYNIVDLCCSSLLRYLVV